MQTAVEDLLYNSHAVDLVLSGHVHAYERSCKVYKYKCVDDAPYYITIGDGGNAEGLATPWVTPQPAWSLFRMASYGHGELVIQNSTHAVWQWHQNQDLSNTIADEFWIVKGASAVAPGTVSVTMDPVFADTPRGQRAAKFQALKAASGVGGGEGGMKL